MAPRAESVTHHAVGIVGHTDRMDEAWVLAEEVEAKHVAIDTGRLGAGRNHLRVWRGLYGLFPDSTWLCVLEDDAVPVEDFRHQLRLALDVAPAPVVSLYLGRHRPGHWQPSIAKAFGMINSDLHDDVPDPCWFTGMGVLHCVGIAIKTSLVASMVDYVGWHLRTTPVDEAMSRWATRLRIDVAHSMPSLVNHNNTLPTLITNRVSFLYGEDSDSRDNDIRLAWRAGTREQWNSSALVVPTPVIAPGAYVHP